MKTLNGEGDLYALEDGTIISWLRVPGDETSAALAFVHQEIDPDIDSHEPVLWVSPGGWSPQSPEQAGVTYPAMALGTIKDIIGTSRDFRAIVNNVYPVHCDVPDHAAPVQTLTLDAGGTWPREAALDAAVRYWQGVTATVGKREEARQVLATADVFVDWLTRDPLTDAMNDVVARRETPSRPFDDGEWQRHPLTVEFAEHLRSQLDGNEPIARVIDAWVPEN